MRLHFNLTPNRVPVPFNYQRSLTGFLHRCLGKNELHDGLSLYSLSWFDKVRVKGGALDFPQGGSFFISAPNGDFLKALMQGIQDDPTVNWGMEVESITMRRTPDFGSHQRFFVQSPVLIKRPDETGSKYYFPQDGEANQYLTETLKTKLSAAGLTDDVEVAFDATFSNPRIKKITYNGIDIKGTECPVLVTGDPRAVQFAWEVGVGNSTGIGFGALK